MKRAVLIEKETGKRIPLSGKTTVGRAEDNAVVVPLRQCSRYHCVLVAGLLGGWKLKQLEKETVGPARQSATYVGRQGRVVAVVSGSSWKLESGDELAFGRPRGSDGVEFTHTFWISDEA